MSDDLILLTKGDRLLAGRDSRRHGGNLSWRCRNLGRRRRVFAICVAEAEPSASETGIGLLPEAIDRDSRMRRARTNRSDGDSEGGSESGAASVDGNSKEAEAEVMKVLAVDDNVIDRKLIEMLLKTSAFKVTAVNSAKRAMEVLGLSGKGSPPRETTLDFDLIITDYCMPEMTGYDLLTRVKDSAAWKDVPVVIMSSENVPRRINRCMAEGAQEFIIKPVQLTDVQRLKGHVRQARELQAEMMGSPVPSKRKNSSPSLPAQGDWKGRRARLSELTVA